MSRLIAASLASALLAFPGQAHAIRFTLGLATQLTPIVVESPRASGLGVPTRFGFQPVVDVEINPWFSFGAYAPFTVLRSGEGPLDSSGAESVFGVSVSLRYPILHPPEPGEPPEARREQLFYVSAKGGFGTVDGKAGPFLGAAIGAAYTWLDTGRGWFAEVGASHVHVKLSDMATDRWLIGLTLGLVFRLGGDDFWLASSGSDL